MGSQDFRARRGRRIGENRPPTAAFDISPAEALAGVEEVTFDGSPSSDPDNDALTYEWDLTDDGLVDETGETAAKTFGTVGNQSVTLTVDDGHSQGHKTKSVTVIDPTIDSWDDGDLSEYSTGTKHGTASISVSSQGRSGDCLDIQTNGDDTVGVYSDGGLDMYPQPGHTTEAWIYTDQITTGEFTSIEFYIGYPGSSIGDGRSNQGIVSRFRGWNGGEWLIQVLDSGGTTSYDPVSIGGLTAGWYRFVVDWQSDGTIISQLWDGDGNKLAESQGNDLAHQNEDGYGLTVYADHDHEARMEEVSLID